MKVLPNAAVLGLVPVPPMPGHDGEAAQRDSHDEGTRLAQDGLEASTDHESSQDGRWARVVKRLSLALNGFFVIALTVGPSAASSYYAHKGQVPALASSLTATASGNGKPLRPITFGIQPRHATKSAMAVPPDLKGGSVISPTNPTEIVIDLIVAYTKKAADHYDDIRRELVELAVAEGNESFRVSNLGHIKLRLVHAYQTDYVEEGMHFDHVWRFADKGDGYMEEIHGLRNRYRADVAILIVDDAKGCGLATRVQADADEAFAVVHHECAAASYTLAHEVGHLIGARHELGYVNGTKWRDIMSYKDACGGCPRVAVWSSPTVLVNGEPAGTLELNNARIIAEQAARVAAFR